MPGFAPLEDPWSEFSFAPERKDALKRLLLPTGKYKRYGYRTGDFSHEELLWRFDACCRRCAAFALKPEPEDGPGDSNNRLKCMMHPGHKLENEQIWSCCRTTSFSYPGEPSGCLHFPTHDWTSESPLPRKFWDLHPTPPFKPQEGGRPKRPRIAVSLDCEMATNRFNQPELVKLSLVDLFTKDVLIDALVKPQAKIKNMLTMIHGITHKDIASAVHNSKAILGRDAAREKIFEFVGPETMVFVHGGTNDFMSLRWYHSAVVDTQEVESRVKRIGDDDLDDWLSDEGTGLEAMCRVITGVHIRRGRGIHNSLEDAMACRELGIWYANNLKGGFDAGGCAVVVAKGTNSGSLEGMGKHQPGPRGVCGGQEVSTVPALVNCEPEAPPSGQWDNEKDLGPRWECKVCKVGMPVAQMQQHRVGSAHMERLTALIQQRGG